jgi:hypothetical protein
LEELLRNVDLTPDSMMSFDQVFRRVRATYDANETPGLLHVADFFTPTDFAASPSLTKRASRTALDEGRISTE